VNARITVTAAVAAILCLPLAKGEVPQITLMPEPQVILLPDAPVRSEGPAVSFSVPKYTLTDDERELVAACLVLEAASQGERGMRGVMAVIRNRSRGLPELFTTTVLEEKQFSALNKLTAGRESLWRMIHRAQRDRMWPAALAIVDEATQDTWTDPTAGATHYTRTGEHTRWTHTLARTVTIGRHAFYR
jgi:spore germination cell wall hydrolase CwlJ-like protein